MSEIALTIQRVMRQTTEARLPQMMRNLAENMQLILNGKNVYELPKHKNTPALVIGAGPSVWREKHLTLLKESDWIFPIVACDKMLIPMLKENIVPDYVTCVDGHSIIAKFFDDPIVDEYSDRITAVMPVTIHPSTANRFKGDIYWYIPRMDDFQVKEWMSLTKALAFMCVKSVLVTGANCGTFSWNLSFYLEHNPIILIGMDLSYDTMDRTKTTYYNALKNYYKGDEKEVEKAIKKGFNPIFKRHFLIDPVFETYHAFMMNYINQVDIETLNCTEGGALFPSGSLTKPKCVPFREVLKRYKHLQNCLDRMKNIERGI